jgi:hypothetical protein
MSGMNFQARSEPLKWAAVLVTLLAAALSAPPLRHLIEQSMVWHMVIQMPLLVMAGYLAMRKVRGGHGLRRFASWNRYGLTGFAAAQGILAYWMLPLAIDQAIVVPQVDALKLASLFVCGALVQRSIALAPTALHLFFTGYMVSMLLWLGIYFFNTDLRLCNAYSLESQYAAGQGLVLLAVAIVMLWLGRVLTGPGSVDQHFCNFDETTQ